ncbi:hypothetical protein [Georgenia deserti]|uniref:Uncharacterized protein n=1 Tax=Georgenia deserti TaxID=2093781 RepID=A0ABW4L723_9MICO
MSQAQPFQPNLQPDEERGIPAADPGPGAPPTAPGFGEGYEPGDFDDDQAPADGGAAAERTGVDDEDLDDPNLFNPPDPEEVGPDEE